jgi:hypothetical protein
VLEDGNRLGDPAKFGAMLDDLASHGLDTVYLVNTRAAAADPFLAAADERGMGVVWAASELNELWWPEAVPATLERAREVVYPLVDRLTRRAHPSLIGYHVVDEPGLHQAEKTALAVRAFRERDPTRPAMPILIGLGRAERMLPAIEPAVMVADAYPLAAGSGPCEFAMDGFGYPGLAFAAYLRRVTATKPAETPLWTILQTHRYDGGGGPFALRQPSAAEVRAQHWMAIGEGATGIFWFVYGSQQGWIGLEDNPVLLGEVGRLAERTKPLRSTLLGLRHAPDRFSVAGGGRPYVGTLAGADDRRLYAVVVNRSCDGPRRVTVSAPGMTGRLRNVETGTLYEFGAPITLGPGDGALLELVEEEKAGEGAGTPPAVGVPRLDPPYGADVEAWWATHPFNPENAAGIGVGEIVSPEPVVNVRDRYGGDIQAAIDALPEQGGTLFFEPGRYALDFRIVGRGNIHFVSDGGAVLAGGYVNGQPRPKLLALIAGCPEAADYGAFDRAVSLPDDPGHEQAIACVNNRPGGIYFKNLVFDGEGDKVSPIRLAATRDVLFDDVTFRGFVPNATATHDGLVNGHEVIDNVWFRGCRFEGRARVAVYLDGLHGGGVIGSTIADSNGPLFLHNGDFTQDYDGDGALSPSEIRAGRYLVVEGNRMLTAGAVFVAATAGDVLVRANIAERLVNVFVDFDWVNSRGYAYYGNKVIGNDVRQVAGPLVDMGYRSPDPLARGGRYAVRDNVLRDGRRLTTLVEERGFVDGPNVVDGNCVAGRSAETGARCRMPAP